MKDVVTLIIWCIVLTALMRLMYKQAFNKAQRDVQKLVKMELEKREFNKILINDVPPEPKVKHVKNIRFKNGDTKLRNLHLSERTLTACDIAGFKTVQDVFDAFSSGDLRELNPSARRELNDRILKYKG